MHRYETLFEQAHIDVADLPPEVDLKGVLIYFGTFPHGWGRLLVHPRVEIGDNPEFVALVAHEVAHLLLNLFGDHPRSVLDLLLTPGQRALYDHYEREADQLAAALLVPQAWRDQCPGHTYPTPESLAQKLGVPCHLVHHALAAPDYDPAPIRHFLQRLIGRGDFAPPALSMAA